MSKIVIVDYHVREAFKIPKGIDLEDETKIEYWYVRRNVLYIVKVGGEKLTIDSQGWLENEDFKYPSDGDGVRNGKIEEACDYLMVSDDEEEDCN
jgi:hypothetical protein